MMDNDSPSERLLSEQQKLFPNSLSDNWPVPSPDGAGLPQTNPLDEGPKKAIKPRQRVNQTEKVPRRPKKDEEEQKQLNKGHWSLEENKKYHWFLQLHYKHFVNSHMRRTDKIFKTMQQFIGTRQAEQCRSHHQKMEKKYLKFTVILTNLRESHYHTLDTTPIRQELEELGVPMTESLPNIEQLAQMAQIQNQSEVKVKRRPIKKARSDVEPPAVVTPIPIASCGLIEEKEEEKEQPHDFNMFEECQNHNIGEISLHLKEDSCPFQSIFHPHQ